MLRVVFNIALAILLAAGLAYFALENPETVSVSLGMLAPGRRPQVFVWEVAVFASLATLFLVLVGSLPTSRNRGGQRALIDLRAEIQEQGERLEALEAQLRTVGMIPIARDGRRQVAQPESGDAFQSAGVGPSVPASVEEEAPADDAVPAVPTGRVRVSRSHR